MLVLQDDRFAFHRLCHRVPDWQGFFYHAEVHGVAALLRDALRKSDFELPAEEACALDRRVAAGRLMLRHQHLGMSLILTAFEKAGLPPVVLKGPVLAERLYGDPFLRSWTDLDLLVSPDEVDVAATLLESLGFQQLGGPRARYIHTRHLTFFHDELSTVDLHFHLLVDFGATVPAADFLKRAVPYRMQGGTTCRVLAAEDEVLYLCLHAAHHEFSRFSWLYDIWTFLGAHQDLDWDVLFQRAKLSRVREAIFYSVELLGRRMGITHRNPSYPLGRQARQTIATMILRIYSELTPQDSPSTLTRPNIGVIFRASLCDRVSSIASFLGQHGWRITRQRLHRYLAWMVPEEWSA
jgi:hypothetical protein